MHNFPSTVYELHSLKTDSHLPIGIDIVGGTVYELHSLKIDSHLPIGIYIVGGTGYFFIFIQLGKNHFHL